MKSYYLTLAALVLPMMSVANAETINQATISGSITKESTPVVTNTTNYQSSTSFLQRLGFNNAAILDAMVANEDLSTKVGYALVEIFNDGGSSAGFFAYRASDGDLVEVSSDILSSFELRGEVSATASTSRQIGNITANTDSTSFTGVADLTLLDSDATAFYNGNRSLRNGTYTNNTVQAIIGYYAVNYIATIRGSGEGEIVDAILISSGGLYKTNLLGGSEG